jgi:uncharacterized protein YigA (DUF484 family)
MVKKTPSGPHVSGKSAMGDHVKVGLKGADLKGADLKGENPKAELRESDVIAYLRRNPRVLMSNPDLLAVLAPDTRFETDTVVVDMQRFVVDRLRRQVDDMKVASDRLVTTTRSNMSLVERTMECALALLYARDFSELTQILHDDLPVHLGVDAVAVAFESETLPVEAGQTVRSLPTGFVDHIMGNNSTVIRADTEGEAALYGSAAGLVRSDAIVALPDGEGLPVGLFAVGCRTPGHFEPGQGTELIAFLAHVTRYAVGRWWSLQL